MKYKEFNMLFGKSFYKVIIPTTLLAICHSTAQANFSFKELSPFVGVDIGQSNTKLQQKFGGPIFRKNATLYNFFGGLEFNEFFGMEIGYQRDNTRKKNNTSLKAGNFVPGDVVIRPAPFSPVVFNTLLKSNNKYLGIAVQYPVFENFNVSILLGLSKTNIKGWHLITKINNAFQNEQDVQDNLYNRTYKKSKAIPLIRIGGKYKLDNKFSLRVNLTWLGTSAVKINSDQNGIFRAALGNNAPNNSIRLKNTLKYSIGFIGNIF